MPASNIPRTAGAVALSLALVAGAFAPPRAARAQSLEPLSTGQRARGMAGLGFATSGLDSAPLWQPAALAQKGKSFAFTATFTYAFLNGATAFGPSNRDARFPSLHDLGATGTAFEPAQGELRSASLTTFTPSLTAVWRLPWRRRARYFGQLALGFSVVATIGGGHGFEGGYGFERGIPGDDSTASYLVEIADRWKRRIRLAIPLTVAFRIAPRIRFGLGAVVHLTQTSPVWRKSLTAPSSDHDYALSEEATKAFTAVGAGLVAGVLVDPHPRLRIGVTYRSAYRLRGRGQMRAFGRAPRRRLAALADGSVVERATDPISDWNALLAAQAPGFAVAGIGQDGAAGVLFDVTRSATFTQVMPHRVGLGLSLRLVEAILVNLDFQLTLWERARRTLSYDEPVPGLLTDRSIVAHGDLRNTWTLGFGVEVKFATRTKLRGGYRFAQSPLRAAVGTARGRFGAPDVRGDYALAGLLRLPRHILALGLNYAFGRGGRHVVDVSFVRQLAESRTSLSDRLMGEVQESQTSFGVAYQYRF